MTTLAREPHPAASALKRTAFADGLAEDVIEALSVIALERHYAPGDLLFGEGTPADGFFLLLSGRVNFTISEGSRRPKLVGWLEKGQAVGLSAMVAEKPHAVSAVAALKVSVLFFPKRSMKLLLGRYPELWLRISLLLSAGVQQAYSHRVALCRNGSPS